MSTELPRRAMVLSKSSQTGAGPTLSLPRKPLPPRAQSLVIWGHVNTPRA